MQFRNIKLEVLDNWTDWSAAPEDIYGLANRVSNAESRITQNANSIALKVSTSTYDSEKIYRGITAPSSPLYINMLWLDTSVTPTLLKRYDGSTWIAAGAQEVKSSGVYIGNNNVSITTENFLLQLLDPANNENVLMEMSANGNVGFNQLYAGEVISGSVPNLLVGKIKHIRKISLFIIRKIRWSRLNKSAPLFSCSALAVKNSKSYHHNYQKYTYLLSKTLESAFVSAAI